MFTGITDVCIIEWRLIKLLLTFFSGLLNGIRLHSGRTNDDYAHNDYKRVSGWSYHWHHGLLAHLHPHEASEPEMAIYEYVNKKLSAKNYSVLPAPYNYMGTESGYTVGNVKNPFLNDGKLLLSHKIINPEHVYKALNIVPEIGPVDEVRKDIARHCADDDFDTAEDTALAFVLRYLAQAQSRGGGYYSGICSRTYITSPENIQAANLFYFCPYKTVPSNLEISMGGFPQFDIEAFVFTDDTPTKWPLSYRWQIVNYYIKSDRPKVYYIRGKNLYCWSNLLTEPPGVLLCSLKGIEQTEDIDEPVKGFQMQELKDDSGKVISRIFTYDVNPLKETVVLYFGGSNRENLASVASETSPKVMINAGFFYGNNKSIGWAYNEIAGLYANAPIPLLNDEGETNQDYEYFQTLFYYEDGSSETIKTTSLSKTQVQEKAKNAVFVISGTKQPDKSPNSSSQRSMIGIRADGSVILLASDAGELNDNGYGIRRGLSVPDGEKILSDMGAINILNLDGGGSTQFFYDGDVLTLPGDPGPTYRAVGSVLQVYDK